MGGGSEADFPAALRHFLIAAEGGHPSGQFYAGRMYQLGHGTKTDGHESAKWYRLAGENGQARAWNNLGNLYASGPDLEHDREAAMRCYKKASDMGMAMGSDNLGKIYHYGKHGVERDYPKALYYYRLCLHQSPSYPGVWNNIGIIAEGGHGLEKNLHLAVDAFQQGITQNDPDAFYNLGRLYYSGELEAEPETIIDLYERSAELGHHMAQFRLGWIYENKLLETNAPERAIGYYEKAAEQGHSMAQNNLAMCLIKNQLEEEHAPRIIHLLRESATQGNRFALSNLGYRKVYGKFDGADPRKGIDMLIISAEMGHQPARNHLKGITQDEAVNALFTAEELQRWSLE